VVLLSRNEAYAKRTHATVAPVTSTVRKIPVEVAVGIPDGFRRDCAVNLDDIQTIRISAIDNHLTTLSPEKLRQVEDAIAIALDLPDYK
jgi:mRNA interferase MazF